MDLKQWLSESGLSAKVLASELGVTQSIVYYWLRGERVPAPQTMKKLLGLSNDAIDANTFYK